MRETSRALSVQERLNEVKEHGLQYVVAQQIISNSHWKWRSWILEKPKYLQETNSQIVFSITFFYSGKFHTAWEIFNSHFFS